MTMFRVEDVEYGPVYENQVQYNDEGMLASWAYLSFDEEGEVNFASKRRIYYDDSGIPLYSIIDRFSDSLYTLTHQDSIWNEYLSEHIVLERRFPQSHLKSFPVNDRLVKNEDDTTSMRADYVTASQLPHFRYLQEIRFDTQLRHSSFISQNDLEGDGFLKNNEFNLYDYSFSTGIHEPEEHMELPFEFSIVAGEITVETHSIPVGYLTLYTAVGQVVALAPITGPQTRLNIPDVPTGIYYLTVEEPARRRSVGIFLKGE